MSSGGAQFHRIPAIWDAANSTIYSQPELWHYAAGTANALDIWSDEAKTTPLAQPFVAGTDGEFAFFADGDYKFVVFENGEGPDGTPIKTWDTVKVTSDTATMWEGNLGVAAPSATTDNLGHLFMEHKVTTNDFEKLSINHGTGAGGVGPVFLNLIEYDGSRFLWPDLALGGPIIDVIYYGADPTGATDSSAAIQNAATAIAATGGGLYFPKGTYEMTTDIDIVNKPIRIFGDGQGISIIKWVAGTDYGIDFDSTDRNDMLIVHDLSLHTEVAGGGDAINALWASGTSGRTNLIIRDVEITTTIATAATAYFTRGIVTSFAYSSHIENVSIIGKSLDTAGMTAAISSSDGDNIHILNSTIFFAKFGIYLTGALLESLVTGNIIEYVERGVVYDFSSLRAGHLNTDNSIIAFLYGIFCTYLGASKISDNTIIKHTSSTEDFWGLTLEDTSERAQVSDNSIRGAGTSGNDTGMVLNADNCTISNNHVEDQDTGINCLVSSNTNYLIGNRAENNTNDYADAGTGNKWSKNYLSENQSIAWDAGESITIPPVGETFKITGGNANPALAQIETIIGGWAGRSIILYKADGDTLEVQIVNEGTGDLKLNAVAGNMNMDAGDHLSLHFDGTKWYEITRSNNSQT